MDEHFYRDISSLMDSYIDKNCVQELIAQGQLLTQTTPVPPRGEHGHWQESQLNWCGSRSAWSPEAESQPCDFLYFVTSNTLK